MADETTTTDKPLAIDPVVVDAGTSPTERLRAFEDREFGPDVVRINGEIERGSGSPFKDMKPAKHREYAAIEKLIETEAALSDAEGKLLQAKADHDAAEEALAHAESDDGDE